MSTENKSVRITFRVTEKEANRLYAKVKRLKTTLSKLMRALTTGETT